MYNEYRPYAARARLNLMDCWFMCPNGEEKSQQTHNCINNENSTLYLGKFIPRKMLLTRSPSPFTPLTKKHFQAHKYESHKCIIYIPGALPTTQSVPVLTDGNILTRVSVDEPPTSFIKCPPYKHIMHISHLFPHSYQHNH